MLCKTWQESSGDITAALAQDSGGWGTGLKLGRFRMRPQGVTLAFPLARVAFGPVSQQ